jgi:ferric hydroxamate transport system ATP-binding protein
MVHPPERSSLRASGVSLAHGDLTVVHDADIVLGPGRITALVGPNGSGKSTLLRALARLHRPASGDVSLADGIPAQSLSAREFAVRVTMLTQHRPSPGGVSVRDVVGYGRFPHRARWRGSDPEGARVVDWAMGATGVTSMASRGVDALSGGELQRVWLASCLAQQTPVLLLDEPTNHLDLRYQIDILDVVRDLADTGDVAVGIVLHDLDQAAAVADDVVLMKAGRVHACGSPEEVVTEAHLADVFGVAVRVGTDPTTGLIHTQPLGRHSSRRVRAVCPA